MRRNRLSPVSRRSVAAALPIEVRGQFAQKNYEDRNPNLGAVLTAMWPFDPLERPVIWRWASDDALNRGTEADCFAAASTRTCNVRLRLAPRAVVEAVERAALAVELAVGAGEDDPQRRRGGRSGGERRPPCIRRTRYTASPPFPNPCAPARRWTGTRSRLLLLMMARPTRC